MKTTRDPADPLARYRALRDFAKTAEPPATDHSEPVRTAADDLAFVVQKHAATRLHYDFRLEWGGVLLSWAVPKGPSFDPLHKRMAIRTEDHPLAYASFEGTIAPGQYGAGSMIVWDRGRWEPLLDPEQGLREGKLVFRLHGEKLGGAWELIRTKATESDQEAWLLFKKRGDAWARPQAQFDVVSALPDSVVVGTLGVEAALPAKLAPQLAALALQPPRDGDWRYEIKFDGYRMLTRLENGQARIYTRAGNDWTDKLPHLARAIEQSGVGSGWFDGEAVVLGADGVPDFNALQNAFDGRHTQSIVYFLFDLPFVGGRDLRKLPLSTRRRRLAEIVAAQASPLLRFSADFDVDPASILDSARRLRLEGVVAKRADSVYESRRTETWLKIKCGRRQEFVVAGFSERSAASGEVGSLLLAIFDDAGKLIPCGSVGTGWDARAAAELWQRLLAIESSTPAFDAVRAPVKGRWPRRAPGTERWTDASLVVEVSFGDWTHDGQVRFPVFCGRRDDKPPRSVRRERAIDAAGAGSMAAGTAGSTSMSPGRSAFSAAAVSSPATVGGASARALKVSNPERVIDASSGATKLDLVRYYESVAERLLPHLRGRPVSLLRGPSGIGGELFFQKHGESLGVAGMKHHDPGLFPGHGATLGIDSVDALIGAAQMNSIELHTCNALAKSIDRPDRIVFDLDPGEGTEWSKVREAALLARAALDELGLASWLKTSGGKGLHVVVPLAPKLGDEAFKGFSQAVVVHLAQTIPQRFVA
ncbi:MAG: DNA ligase D, partial [Pseudomonadota bacterium]|nr:DNA ligase D [Pseudomonadota bacterium]